ncbi:non-ribosomal peptide synthetase [Protofrankia symbiont of Coriaria ruscifolia]|uniref:non-ribosomal peptide synthetase n=1 Tax=Protofrankia symbiont of Coriaria ruscifolia TaxID=1306542 RepID=UPI0010414128|nr:non-ribosomal peptide synthetase [Protofrankia symbiont of Coriaria ruscifolia]
MEIDELIAELGRDGVTLWADSGRLRFRAPRGVLTPQRRDLLREHREEVLDQLERDQAVPGVTADAEGRYEPFPLSDIQAAYLIGRGDSYDYGGVACHAYIELAFPAELEPERVQAAWDTLVARHDMLRAVVHPDGYQVVLANPPPYRIDVVDLRGRAEDEVSAAVLNPRAELSHRVAWTEVWPLCAVRATRSDRQLLLHLSLDLLVVDYASVQLLLREFGALCTNPAADLPPLGITFRDYLVGRRRRAETALYQRDREYWLHRLDTLPPAPELPLAERRGPESEPVRFTRLEHLLPASVWAALALNARRHGVTTSAALLTAYAEVIGRWSRSPRFTLNLPTFQRLDVHPDVGTLIGDFTAVELLAVDLSSAASFAERVRAISARLLDDLSHALFTGSEVLTEIARREDGRPLMPVVFTSTLDGAGPAGPADPAGSGLGAAVEAAGEVVFAISQTPQVWLDCQVMSRGDALAVSWDVRGGVFPDGLAEAAFSALITAIIRLATDSDAWTRPAPVELPEDQMLRHAAVNDTATDLPDELLHAGVLAQAAATPDAVAVVAADRQLTYGELIGRASAVAAVLADVGLRPAEPVAVGMDKGWEQIVAVLGVLLAGGAYLPLDIAQPAARRDVILRDAGVRHVLTQTWLADPAGWPAGLTTVAVDAMEPTGAARTVSPIGSAGAPDDLAYIIYTSGSTGAPKGVMISHRAALNTIIDINRRFQVTADDAVLGLASLGFDLSVYDVFGPLRVGARLVLPDGARRGDPSHWAGLISAHAVTVWNSVPAQMQMLVEFLRSASGGPAAAGGASGGAPSGGAAPDVTTLRLAMLSGDWIPVTLPDEARTSMPGLRLVSLGGATEGAIWSIVHPIDQVDTARPSIPYGTPLSNQSFAVFDGALRDRPDWVPGELHIGGAGVALGYHGDPERTAARFIRHPATGDRLYRTGDLGRYLPDGTIEFLGREDDQVKIRGFRIELAEVEAAVLTHPAVAAGAVLVDDEHPLGRRLAAFVEPARRTEDDGPRAAGESTDATPPLVAAAAATAIRTAGAGMDPAALAELLAAMDDVALAVMARTLSDAGLLIPVEGQDDGSGGLDADEVCAVLRTTPPNRHIVRRWLRALAATSRLAVTERPATEPHLDRKTGVPRYHGLVAPDAAALEQAWARLGTAQRRADYSTDLLDLMRTCTAHLPVLLSGEQDIRVLLFPGAEPDALAAAYRDNLAVRHLNQALSAGLRQLAERHVGEEGMRILEVGGGVAGATTELVPALAEFGVDYLFTDPSRFFLTEAAERFADHPWVRYGRFDLAADPREQGYLPNSFDVILCPHVLHNATDIPAALRRLRELLVPGGWLVFTENTRDDHYPLAVSLEFLEVTSGPRTDLRAATGASFVTDEQWPELLADLGVELVAALPEPTDTLHPTGQRVFFTQVKTDRHPLTAGELTRHVGSHLPDYMIPTAWQVLDALPLTANGKVDRSTLRRWLPRGGGAGDVAARSGEPVGALERQLAELWAELLGVERVGRHEDFFALGGDSLLVARLVGQVRERLPDVVALEWEVVLRHMLRAPTVAALATFLRGATGREPAAKGDQEKVSPVVPLHGAGLESAGGPVTVLVHAGTGTVMPYRALITEIRRRSAGTTALVGLEIPRLADYLGGEPTGQIEALAASYARSLLELGPRDLHLVGYCLGGLIAIEVARGLAEAGAPVASFTAISSHSPRFRLDDEILAEYSFAVMMGIHPPDLGFPDDQYRVAAASDAVLAESPGVLRDGALARLEGEYADIADSFRALASVPRSARIARMCEAVPASAGMYEPDHMTRLFLTFRQSVFSISRYQPEPYAGDVTFLRHGGAYPFPGSRDAVTAQWEEVCLGDLRIVDVPGDHFSCLSVEHAPGVLRLLGQLTDGAVTR